MSSLFVFCWGSYIYVLRVVLVEGVERERRSWLFDVSSQAINLLLLLLTQCAVCVCVVRSIGFQTRNDFRSSHTSSHTYNAILPSHITSVLSHPSTRGALYIIRVSLPNPSLLYCHYTTSRRVFLRDISFKRSWRSLHCLLSHSHSLSLTVC